MTGHSSQKDRKMRKEKITVFYREEQVCQKDIQGKSFSKSPLKPKLLMEYLAENGFADSLNVIGNFRPMGKRDFKLAHTPKYVNNFYAGKGNCRSNSLPWSRELVESVQYTNSSLYHAIKYACKHPEVMTFSPTSGFHHAGPGSGSGFCTFSGQVIASTKLYRQKGLVGAYLDLDGHFGNSIGDSKKFVSDLNESIYMNINPRGSHNDYIGDFVSKLSELEEAIRLGLVDYVVWCHGADSHEWDSLGHQCTTEEWIMCSRIFYKTIASLEKELGRHIPVTLSLFGGYRDDDYESVLSLHASDIREGMKILLNKEIDYETKVSPRNKVRELVTT